LYQEVGMAPDDQDWFESLYAASYARLVLITLANSRDIAEAEEIVQEAFAKAYAKQSTVRAADNAAAWVCAVAINLARRRWRRRAMFHRLMRRDPPPGNNDTDTAALVDVRTENADLYRAIRALPDVQREAVFLHHLADLPLDEVAARTGVPVGTVKSRLSRGRTALAEKLVLPPEVRNPQQELRPAGEGQARP